MKKGHEAVARNHGVMLQRLRYLFHYVLIIPLIYRCNCRTSNPFTVQFERHSSKVAREIPGYGSENRRSHFNEIITYIILYHELELSEGIAGFMGLNDKLEFTIRFHGTVEIRWIAKWTR